MKYGSLIASDFDHARQDMLAEFRRLIAAHPDMAQQEANATTDAMRQLLWLETADA